MLSVIAVKLLEAIIPRQSGKTVDRVDVPARECLAHPEFRIQLAKGVAGKNVVVYRVGIVLGVSESTALQNLAHESALHLVLRAAHEEARFGYENIRGEEAIVKQRDACWSEHRQSKNNMP